MKYTTLVNTAGVVAAGLHTKTDLTDWAILEYIKDWQATPNATRRGGLKVWINYAHLIEEMPLLPIKEKTGISKRIAKLRGLGLVETEQSVKDSRLFAEITAYCHSIMTFSVASTTPTKPRKPVDLDQHPVDLDQHTAVIPRSDYQEQREKEVAASEKAAEALQAVVEDLPAATLPAPRKQAVKAAKPSANTAKAWEAYSGAYETRYGVTPLRNAKVNGQLATLVRSVGEVEAGQLAAFYVGHNKSIYVQRRHPVDFLLSDMQALHTDLMTGEQMTSQRARQVDSLQGTFSAVEGAKRLLAAKRQRQAAQQGAA